MAIYTRAQQKHDIEANWIKAKNFIPLEGEIIIYDADENYSYQRIKIGDGTTKVKDLPFDNIQGDWSQNDETASDYVKNRTHYIETPQGKNVLECSIASHFTWGADSSPNLSAHGVSVNMPTVGEIMHAVVTANGISRRFSGTLLKNSFDEMWIGDASKLSGVRYPGNEGEFDFAFVVAPPSYFECYFPVEGFGTIAEGDIVNIHLYTGDPTVIIHQLDEKYIPDTIARKSDIAEQVQADWNQNDETKSDYIKNRTHYETVGYADIYSIQGMSSYINKDSENHNGATVYQLSLDDYPLYDSVPGTKIKVTVNAQVGSTDIKTNFECTINDSYTAGNPALYSIYEDDNGERGAFYSDGKDSYLYIIHDTDYEYSYENCNLDIQIQAQTDIVVQLDEKYIPDSIAKKSDVLLIDNKLSDKVDKISGKGLSTNDYTNEDKEKLNSVQYGAEKNVQPDWQQIDETSPDFIKNKTHYEVNISDKESIYTTERQGFSLTGENYNGFSVYRIEVSQGISIFDRYPVGTLFKLVVDSSETVIFEGTKHTDTSAMGNPYLYGGETDTGENCYVYSDGRDCVICVASNETMPAGSLNLKIVYTVSELKQLDEKYIPDTIARTEDVISLPPYTSADEGKILQIVNGVPTWVSLPNAEEATF